MCIDPTTIPLLLLFPARVGDNDIHDDDDNHDNNRTELIV